MGQNGHAGYPQHPAEGLPLPSHRFRGRQELLEGMEGDSLKARTGNAHVVLQVRDESVREPGCRRAEHGAQGETSICSVWGVGRERTRGEKQGAGRAHTCQKPRGRAGRDH